jgi:Excalibur calcium-binding domain
LLDIDGACCFDYLCCGVYRLAILLGLVCAATLAASTHAVSAPWKNCAQVNKRYPHGVGKISAHDKTSGVPVRNFKHSNRLYALALKNNGGLDRDHDGIACESA